MVTRPTQKWSHSHGYPCLRSNARTRPGLDAGDRVTIRGLVTTLGHRCLVPDGRVSGRHPCGPSMLSGWQWGTARLVDPSPGPLLADRLAGDPYPGPLTTGLAGSIPVPVTAPVPRGLPPQPHAHRVDNSQVRVCKGKTSVLADTMWGTRCPAKVDTTRLAIQQGMARILTRDGRRQPTSSAQLAMGQHSGSCPARCRMPLMWPVIPGWAGFGTAATTWPSQLPMSTRRGSAA